MGDINYAGFWDTLLNYVVPAVVVVLFWVYRSATPDKMGLSLAIVEADSGGKPFTGQLIGRYLGYYILHIGDSAVFKLYLGRSRQPQTGLAR